MSYSSHGYGLGADASALLTAITRRPLPGLSASIPELGVRVPADCATTTPIYEGIRYPVAPTHFAPGQLYVVAWPLLKKLSPTQGQQLTQYFQERMDPAMAAYPDGGIAPCDLALRKADACVCRDRKNPARWQHHRHIGDSWDVQSCLGRERTRAVRHWISFFHQLLGWTELPHGYREINGDPYFVWTIFLNPNPKREFYARDGSIASGNLGTSPKRLPQLPRQFTINYAANQLRAGLGRLGFRGSDLSPGIAVNVDRLDKPQLEMLDSFKRLKRQIVGEDAAEEDPWREVALPWDPEKYRRNADYRAVVDSAITQAAAYIGTGTKLVWQALGSTFVTGLLIAPGTDRTVRSRYNSGGGRMRTMLTASQLILNSEAATAQVIEQGQALLQMPPEQAYQIIRRMRADVTRGIEQIQTALSYQTATFVPELEQTATTAVTSIRQGLDRALAKLASSMPGLNPELRTRWRCKLYRKAKHEADEWPGRIRGRIPAMRSAISAWNATKPGAAAALGRYQEVLQQLAYIESQLALPWWKKDYGPLPGWGWGMLGVGAFLGTAVAVRRARKKKPRKNRRRARRTSRRAA